MGDFLINDPIEYVKKKGWKEIQLQIQFGTEYFENKDFITPDQINNYVKLNNEVRFLSEEHDELKFTRDGLINEDDHKRDYAHDENYSFDMTITKRK